VCYKRTGSDCSPDVPVRHKGAFPSNTLLVQAAALMGLETQQKRVGAANLAPRNSYSYSRAQTVTSPIAISKVLFFFWRFNINFLAYHLAFHFVLGTLEKQICLKRAPDSRGL